MEPGQIQADSGGLFHSCHYNFIQAVYLW